MDIRRQSDTHRANMDGQVGPAPVHHQVRSVDVRLDVLPDGGMRVSTPQARGWAVVAAGPRQLLDALNAAFTEAQVASYARWKGEMYELDALTEVDNSDPLSAARPRGVRRRDRTERSDVHDPLDWVELGDGRWRAPYGRAYPADSEIVRKVVRKRRMLGESG
jgi:hypothetical protein